MEGQDLQDLVEGRNEWCNIPSAIRASFRVFNEVVQSQAQYMHILEGQLKEFAERQDKFNDITQGALYPLLSIHLSFLLYLSTLSLLFSVTLSPIIISPGPSHPKVLCACVTWCREKQGSSSPFHYALLLAPLFHPCILSFVPLLHIL